MSAVDTIMSVEAGGNLWFYPDRVGVGIECIQKIESFWWDLELDS